MQKFSNTFLKNIGKRIAKDEANADDLQAISKFRAYHAEILNTLINTISKKIPKPLLIARRLKRLPSIKQKLKRGDITLNFMQDIGGARAIFRTKNDIKQYAKNIKEIYCNRRSSSLELIRENDYIAEPKSDGYRSHHIVFKYCGVKEHLKGLFIELQLRTEPQHWWATAVEIMGIIDKNNNIKAGLGEAAVRRFFAIAAECLDGDETHLNELKALNADLDILNRLNAFKLSAKTIKESSGYVLIVLDFANKNIKLQHFKNKELDAAVGHYLLYDNANRFEAVLLSVSDIKQLTKAYPNYYLDAHKFIEFIGDKIKS